jgi:class 3 adenylate cyclase/tetratricopeptide (TPR) repeat protein
LILVTGICLYLSTPFDCNAIAYKIILSYNLKYKRGDMYNTIPDFIKDQNRNHKYNGKIKCIALSADIVGFTKMTERLMKYGKEGAETVSSILNTLFDPIILNLYKNKGYIAHYTGDGFIGIFPETYKINACFHAEKIQSIFKSNLIHNTKLGKLKLNIKVGLSYGELEWGIVGKDNVKTYYYRGPPIDNCILARKACPSGAVLIDKNLYSHMNAKYIHTSEVKGYYKINKILLKESFLAPDKYKFVNKDIPSEFYRGKFSFLEKHGEFRNVIPVFLSFDKKMEYQKLNKFISTVLLNVSLFGGYFNMLSFGDKGASILILFGAPVLYEHNLERALNFILKLKKEVKIKAGIAFGPVYAGIIGSEKRGEYTVIGEIVNLASRLMQNAHSNEIYTDNNIYKQVGESYAFIPLGKVKLRGFKENKSVYKLIGKNREKKHFYKGQTIARKREFKKLYRIVEGINRCENGGIVYIDGVPGIGKSRFINEFKKSLNLNAYNWFNMPCDGILKQSFNPIKHFLYKYFQIDEKFSKQKNIGNFNKIYNDLISDVNDEDIKEELMRTKSIIGSLIDLFWSNSLYSKIDAKSRYENVIYAFKNFIKASSHIKPTFLIIEDGHLIDKDTENILKILFVNTEDFPFVVITSCRLNNDGSPFRMEDLNVSKDSILIKQLSKRNTKILITNQFNSCITERLFKLIWHKSEGNPFFIEQLIVYLKETNAAMLKDGKYDLLIDEFEILAEISGIIVARIDKLSNNLKDIIKTASILGIEFSIRVLENMIKGKSISNEVKNIEEENIWMAISSIIYLFKHAIIRDTVYEMILKNQLRELHKKAAKSIELLYKNDLNEHYGELAYHYEKAGILQKAKKYLWKAGDYARDNFKNEESINYYIKLLKYSNSNMGKIQILNNAAMIYELTGQWDKAEELYGRSIKLAKKSEYMKIMVNINGNLCKILINKGQYKKAIGILNNSLKVCKDLNDLKGEGNTKSRISSLYYRKGQYKKALFAAKESLHIAKKLGDKYLLSSSLGNLGLAYWICEKSTKGLEYFKEGLKVDKELGKDRDVGITLGNIGIFYLEEGKYKKSAKYFEKSLVIAKKLGDLRGICESSGNMGEALLNIGEFDNALWNFKKELNIAKELGDIFMVGYAYSDLARFYLSLKNYKKAEYYYKKSIKIFKKMNHNYYLCENLYDLGYIYYNLNMINKIKYINKQAIVSAKKADRLDIIALSKLMNVRIIGLSDMTKAEKQILKLLKEYKGLDFIAEIYYFLYKMTQSERDRKKAVMFYKKLYRKKPNFKYKEILEEIEKKGERLKN